MDTALATADRNSVSGTLDADEQLKQVLKGYAAAKLIEKFKAQEVAERIRAGLTTFADTLDLIMQAYQEQHWKILDHANWDSYVDARFGEVLPRLTGHELWNAVLDLEDAGLSQRAIAPILGISQSTVGRIQREVENGRESADAEPGESYDSPPVPRERPANVKGTDGVQQAKTKQPGKSSSSTSENKLALTKPQFACLKELYEHGDASHNAGVIRKLRELELVDWNNEPTEFGLKVIGVDVEKGMTKIRQRALDRSVWNIWRACADYASVASALDAIDQTAVTPDADSLSELREAFEKADAAHVRLGKLLQEWTSSQPEQP